MFFYENYIKNVWLYKDTIIHISLQLICKQEKKHNNYFLFNIRSQILTPGTLKPIRKPNGDEVLDPRDKLTGGS